ncbi:hypothetical protein ACSX1A_03680 [Pontibacter sp. MBLB2868]|uniref:hypothetical protein n=1 Tax=Pontibacter sp. MBLB2868 TaxID=3451555 RepID=UPI003F756199
MAKRISIIKSEGRHKKLRLPSTSSKLLVARKDAYCRHLDQTSCQVKGDKSELSFFKVVRAFQAPEPKIELNNEHKSYNNFVVYNYGQKHERQHKTAMKKVSPKYL